ncbi:Zinc finger BED domain-containing protein 6 [Frankliniella fusca]|uniref:Zinc finger BED domain-containing protein 6 n=1 Tax=Frankliniella fusca TaxID=407009 RepID=A0AAE1I5I0_9NEOP|nr:Zinc finger BED domain-containing protein 6 [Frankliniella fusca]
MSSRKRSAVWALFAEDPTTKVAKCNKCGRRYNKPATETLRYHLLHAHCINVPKEVSSTRKKSGGDRRDREEDEDADLLSEQEVRQQNARDAAGQAQDGLGDGQGQGQDGRGDGQPQRRHPEAPSPSSSFEGPMDKCLSSALGYSRGGVRDKKATDALCYMIAHDDLPLRTPEKDGFQTFSKALQPLWKPPTEPTVTKRLEEKYDSLRESFGRRIASTDHLSLTVDVLCHEETMRSYLGLTVHFREGTGIVDVETGIKYMPEKKTSENLRAAMRELCDEWHIEKEKVRAVVSDGGANIKAAVRDEFGSDRHIACAAHLLNSVGQAAIGLDVSKPPSEQERADILIIPENEEEAEQLLEDVPEDADSEDNGGAAVLSLRPLLMKVKRIVRFFRTSDVASRMLIDFQVQAGKKEHEALKLIQEVRTRWNSCYYMLERFLLLADPVSRILLQLQRERGATKRKPPNLIPGDQLEILTEVRDLLKPLEEATLLVCKGNAVTLSDVIPMVYGLKKSIGAFLPTHPVTYNLQQKTLAEVNKRFSGIEYLRPYAAATMLDPATRNTCLNVPGQ